MRYLLTSFLFAVLNSNAVCQTTTYNPDANEDNVVGVSDMLALLSCLGKPMLTKTEYGIQVTIA